MMVALTRFFLPWVPHIWTSGTNPLQTPRAWFWGTHKWAISAALLAGGVSRTVGSVLVFGPPLHRGIVRRSLRQSSWDGYSVCSGLFWGERWWSVGVAPADGARPGLGCILQSCSGRWLSFFALQHSERGYLESQPQLERGALGSAVIAGAVKRKLLAIWFCGNWSRTKLVSETGSHIGRSAGDGHWGPQRLVWPWRLYQYWCGPEDCTNTGVALKTVPILVWPWRLYQ